MKAIPLLRLFVPALACSLLLGGCHQEKPLRPRASQTGAQAPDNPYEAFKEWAEWEFNLMKDPFTGTIPAGSFAAELSQALATPKVHASDPAGAGKNTLFGVWTSKGPTNLGGRTRALGIDVANNNIMLAGDVSGGIFRSANGGASWTNVTPPTVLHSISTIAQDPRPGQTNNWYYASGEALGNSASENGASFRGNGAYKSTDNGLTWNRLVNSNTGADEAFDDRADYCSRIIVNPTNGDVYLAIIDAIYRSQDGGATWSDVLSGAFGGSGQATDIVCTSTGRLYAAFAGAAPSTMDGVWTSTTGDPSTWARISGNGTPAGWRTNGNYGRMVLALAPSRQDTLFALYYNNTTANCTTQLPEADFWRWSQSAATWTNLTANLPNEPGCLGGNDPFAVQTGYDLCIAVKPDNPDVVFVGGTNAYRSTDGFTSNNNTTRIGGYATPSSYALYTNHHPDIHTLIFASGDPNTLYTGDDGGIQKGNITVTPVVWTSLNNSYITYQFYRVMLDPLPGSDESIGGAQDNGTTYYLTGSTLGNSFIGGDGASVGLDSGGTTYYGSTQNGATYRANSFTNSRIDPANNKSLFVTNFRLDPNNNNHLYYANGNDLYRTNTARTVTQVTGWTLMSGLSTAITSSFKIYGIGISKGVYNTNTASPNYSRLYIGTDKGSIYRIDDPINTPAGNAPADISPPGMGGVSGATCVAIAVHPADSRKIMAVYSNYGINSVWYTDDASAASPVWTNVEGNLSLFSFRSVAILSDGVNTNYIVGTHKGLYSTATLNGASTNWSQESPNMIGYAVINDISYRTYDNTILAGSHGNGLFIATNFPLPVNFSSFTGWYKGAGQVQLDWTVANEKNADHYVVQRSDDGKSYQDIGRVPAKGIPSSDYRYTDEVPAREGDHYLYRIKEVDYNGDAHYSIQVPIRIGKGSPGGQIYPTLVQSSLQVQVNEEGYTAWITDLQGRRVLMTPLRSGDNQLDLSGLPPGNYIVTAVRGPSVVRQKIVKQ